MKDSDDFATENPVAASFKRVNNVECIERLLNHPNNKISQYMFQILERYFGDDEQ